MAKRTYRSFVGTTRSSSFADKPVSRRNFLKMGGLTLGALGLGPLVDGLAGSVANANYIRRLNADAPGFAPLPSSSLLTGQPADISVGWDGSTWATDANGLLHSYDPLKQTWQPFGTGIDAITVTAAPDSLLFRGAEVWAYETTPTPTPQPIGQRWPQLPASFQLGVDGAITVTGVLYLFKNGCYARVDMQQQPRLLSQLAGWPAAWSDGLVDAMGVGGADDGQLLLIHGTQWALADLSAPDMSQHRIVSGPAALSSVFGPRMLALLNSGVDTLYFANTPAQPGSDAVWVFQGPLQWIFSSARDAQPDIKPVWSVLGSYASWPQHWTPQLAHAPGGRAGSLWAATLDGSVVGHNGAGWAVGPAAPGGPAVSAAVDVDGLVYAATAAALHTLGSGGTAWQPLAPAPVGTTLAQVSAGDDGHVWARAASGQVHRLGANNTLAPVPGVTAGHIAASFDGTLWHADGSANAYRLISAGSEPSEQLAVGGATSIAKVATTGYGTSLVLGSSGAAYTYQSPYVFKTATSYNLPPGSEVTQGQNSLFLNALQDAPNYSIIVALDAQSGAERWRLALPATPASVVATNPVYDALNGAVIFGDTRGVVTALAASDGHVLWTYQTPDQAEISYAPALNGSLLVFGDQTGKVYAIDTGDAVRRGAAGQPAAPLWTPYQTEKTGPVLTPVLADGQIYAVTYQLTGRNAGDAVLTQLAPSGTLVSAIKLAKVDAGYAIIAPVRADIVFSRGQQPEAAILVNTGTVITAYSLLENKTLQYAIKNPGSANGFASAMTVYNDVVYVGDSQGYLYALDDTLKPIANTPALISGVGHAIYTRPLVVEDVQGNITALVGTDTTAAVWGYQLTAATPTPVALMPTGQTWVQSLSRNSTNGMIYAGGNTVGSLAQVFGLRIDAEISAARDFMVESQLMQDFDDPPAGAQSRAAVAVARYQTTLTVVDDNRAPRPLEAVKIWAEQPQTLLSVDGVQHPAGPGDNECIVTRTDASGKLTIISGSLQGDTNADRATDLFAVPLRVWAGFMDPFERVIIYPDREFHTRVAGTVATGGAPGAAPTDPDTIDLSTATQYGDGTSQFQGSPLFASTEQQAASQLADVIRQVTGATNLSPATATRSRAVQAQQAAAPDISKYTPDGYNLPGMSYFPTNVPATRAAQAVAPVGLSFVSENGGPISYDNTLSAAEASAAIDALQGQAWTPPGSPLLGGFWGSFWKFLKGLGRSITHIVVSIGKEVYIGIRWVANGVAQFFKNPLGTLEDLVSAIGGFFVKLGKLVENVVEALGLVLHFEHILATKTLIEGLYNDGMASLVDDLTLAQQAVDSTFEQVEEQISAFFEELINDITSPSAGSTPLSGFGSIGKTDHDAFSVGPDGTTQSRTVQCSWGADKLRMHWKSGQSSTGLSDDPNPFTAFLSSFITSLETDSERKRATANALQHFKAGFSFTSVEDFFRSLITEVLSAAELVIVNVVSFIKALLDGLLAAAEALVAMLQNAGAVEIPVLSALWRALTNSDLTFVDLICLVAAIPATVLYRVLDGSYPPDVSAAASDDQVVQRVMGLVSGATMVFYGWLSAAMDAIGIFDANMPQPKLAITITTVLFDLQQIAFGWYSQIAGANRLWVDWIIMGISTIMTGLDIAANTDPVPKRAQGNMLLEVWLCMINVCLYGLQYKVHNVHDPNEKPRVPVSVPDLINNLVQQLPTLVSPLKLAPADTLVPAIVPVADLVCRSASGVYTIAETALKWDKLVEPIPPSARPIRGHRYLPRVMNER